VALWKGEGLLALNDWSGDGRYLLLTRWETSKGLEGRGLWLLSEPLSDTASHEATLLEPAALHGQFRPATGEPRWISYDADEAGSRQIFVRTLPGSAMGKWQISSDGGNTSRWSRDGRELFFIGRTSLMAADVDASQTFRAGTPRSLFNTPSAFRVAAWQYAPGYDVTSDGQRFLSTYPTPVTPPSAINVVINWQTALMK
jgi:Tol biopolymer transport system component